MLVQPGLLMAGGRASEAGAGGRTYPEFVAHIRALASGRTLQWTTYSGADVINGSYTMVAAGTVAGSGYGFLGSPWGRFIGPAMPNPGKVVTMVLPSREAAQAQVDNNYEVFLRGTATGDKDYFVGQTRNGETSYSYDEPGQGVASGLLDEVIYWDGSRPQRLRPGLALGPEPYDW